MYGGSCYVLFNILLCIWYVCWCLFVCVVAVWFDRRVYSVWLMQKVRQSIQKEEEEDRL